MAVKAAAGLVEYFYTPEDEKEDDNPTRFKLRPLDQIDLMQVFSEGAIADSGAFVPNHKGRSLLLRKGLKDWENFNNEDGSPIKFTLANFSRVPAQLLIELANEIMTNSVITEEEKKT